MDYKQLCLLAQANGVENSLKIDFEMVMNFSYNMIPTFIIYAWKLQLENLESSTFIRVTFHHFPTSMKKNP
jgi:hypothetical protein